MAKKKKLQELDPDEIEQISSQTGRSWKEILRENLRLISNRPNPIPVFDDEYIERQQAGVSDMLKRCQELPVVEHGDSINPSTDYKRVLYGDSE